jgi:hypothetical protein
MDVRGRLVVPISAGALRAEPWLQWNAFAALLSHSSVDELHPSQVEAWWVFAYDSELQGGGHAAFFEQHGLAAAEPAAAALRALGAHHQAGLLLAAADRLRETQGKLGDLDAAVEVATPSVTSLLERHLVEHLHDFVLVVQEGAVEQPGAPDKVRR